MKIKLRGDKEQSARQNIRRNTSLKKIVGMTPAEIATDVENMTTAQLQTHIKQLTIIVAALAKSLS